MKFAVGFHLDSVTLASPSKPKVLEDGTLDHANAEPVDNWTLRFTRLPADNDPESRVSKVAAVMPVGNLTIVFENKLAAEEFQQGKVYHLVITDEDPVPALLAEAAAEAGDADKTKKTGKGEAEKPTA